LIKTQEVSGMKIADWPEWRCPTHQRPLEDRGNVLVCPDGDSFLRTNGIPRFVPRSNYADAFGEQWKRHRLTQLDSYTGTTITKDRARRCLGDKLWDELGGKKVLECGCGAGRFTEILLGKGAKVTSIDLSEAVDANQENFPQNDRHKIAQADILQLPLAPQQFDLVFCLGAAQHTPNPEKAIACVFDQVKPGGNIVFDHYTYNISWYTKTAPLFRFCLLRLKPIDGRRWTEWLVDTLLPLHKVARQFYPAQIVLSRISPILCYYQTYPELRDELHREWALLDTHDSLTDRYKHFRTRGQIRRLLQYLGVEEICVNYAGIGVEARGKRSSS